MMRDRRQVLLSASCMIPTLARRPTGLAVVLTQMHHSAISHNAPRAFLAGLLARLGPGLIIEFVANTVRRVRLILPSRRDIFDQYAQQGFETAFLGHIATGESARPCHTGSRFSWIERQGGAG